MVPNDVAGQAKGVGTDSGELLHRGDAYLHLGYACQTKLVLATGGVKLS
jgi:hypothetical protein